MNPNPFLVALTPRADYTPHLIKNAVHTVLDASGWQPGKSRVLVKPNLLRAHMLSCAHPEVVAATCAWLLDQGCTVAVADSPGFGSAIGVAEAIGLTQALKPLGLKVQDLGKTTVVPVPLPDGRSWGVSALAVESDAILSIPKVKAHSQLRLSLGVKNLFGCVCGLRKAVAHTVQGPSLAEFSDAMVALWAALPPAAGLADGVQAMHVTGPSNGKPYALGCLGASSSVAALDTALYTILGARPEVIPLWEALRRRGETAAEPENIHFPLDTPQDFPADTFEVPPLLMDVSFRPSRLLISLAKRLWLAWRA